ncbi:MAG: hypothetical protein F6K54_23030 [Okeania sp. SIO3B5]|uniref:hypothetical protein n=1 Tax=Okeania sp. SIO3B5 TaxID=2607811 RepID=UPI0014017CE8|nr:hypothetical protein [Okeania sp. SIO3B5]NEO55688.1 hypothetical protein [Okeania sp. SIO3B5]
MYKKSILGIILFLLTLTLVIFYGTTNNHQLSNQIQLNKKISQPSIKEEISNFKVTNLSFDKFSELELFTPKKTPTFKQQLPKKTNPASVTYQLQNLN